jgi:hypothetical protein
MKEARGETPMICDRTKKTDEKGGCSFRAGGCVVVANAVAEQNKKLPG